MSRNRPVSDVAGQVSVPCSRTKDIRCAGFGPAVVLRETLGKPDDRGIWAVVPVKELSGAKQRLSGAFPAEFRRELAQEMLSDVLAALVLTQGLDGILVVTVDPTAKQLAANFGAEVISDHAGEGKTAAIHSAVRELLMRGAGGMLTIPGDVPGVTAVELEFVLRAHAPAPSFTIVPAHDCRGSNAVLCSPPNAVPLKFGNDSYYPHLQVARDLGIEPRIVRAERLGLDIDNPEDLFAYARKGWRTNTMSFLEHSNFWVRHSAAISRVKVRK